MREHLDTALQTGNVEQALAVSRQWAEAQAAQGATPDQAGLEIAKAVAAIYRNFITEPVHQYQAHAARVLPEGVGAFVERALKRLVDMTLFWEQRLEMVYRERLARELRDFTRSKVFDSAADNIRLLCGAARSADDSRRLAEYCGTILGTCENHPREVETVIALVDKDPVAFGLTHELVGLLRTARQKRLDIVLGSRMEVREIEWTRSLTETVVEIQRQLPAKDKIGEPDDAMLRDAADLMRSIARIPLWRKQPAKFVDATLLLVEFVPRELAAAAAQSGIEARAYNTIGYTAKKTVLLAFGELGKIELFTQPYEQYTREWAYQTKYFKFFVEVMGATRSPAFHTFMVQCFGEKRLVELRDEIVDALGNIGNADARNLLLKHLEDTLTARVIDPPRVRTATRVITSLAKLSRSPRLTAGERADLVRRSLKALPKDHMRLAMQAALQFFSYNPDTLPKDLREWAVGTLSGALWLQDDSPEWAQGAEKQDSLLGFRQPMTQTLIKLVPEAPAPFLERIERHALRYSGAYMAVAEICEKTKLEASLSVLETMMRNAFVFDDADVSRYDAEMYWDATTQQRVRLSKDKVIGPIVYSIGTIGGPVAFRILSDLDDQFRSQRLAPPGPETARYLDEFLKALAPQFGGSGEGAGAVGAEATSHSVSMNPGRVAELAKILRSSFFLVGANKRRIQKISAISEIGQSTPPEAIAVLIEQLGDKDDMVQCAARTALVEYSARRVPPAVKADFLGQIVAAIESKDPAVRQGALQTLREVGTGRPEVRARLELELKATPSATLGKQIQLLLRESGAGKKAMEATGPGAGAPGDDVDADGEPSPGNGPPASALDLKRQYVVARQEWIRGGKKGPPPEPPSGL